ncbi:hypothetical protein H5410_045833 [Solanum commersonii]|uniref:Uncharacterized protein n=1 Tax=Solanum commersonii TaxID=4109 RepID=A0A9J5XCS5_SOLCO|nr:hypothetical protein H5410_045833 [Solanum commersonii]
MAFKRTSRRFNHVNVSSSSTSAPTPEWQQEMTSMKLPLNGNILEELAHLFPPPPQASNIGSGTQQIPIGPNVD